MSFENHFIQSSGKTGIKMELVNKLEGHQDIVNGALVFDEEDGVLTISDDKSVRIWIKRENGSYWPTVCKFIPDSGTCFSFHEPSRKLFVGMENGIILEFSIGEDYNNLFTDRSYTSHVGKINDIYYSFPNNLILSVGKDKYLTSSSTETGRFIVNFSTSAPCTALQFDEHSKFAFVGNILGEILLVKLDHNNVFLQSVLKGHSKEIRCLKWDAKKQMLFSASNDLVVICWDIGGKKGTAFELQGHFQKISSVCFATESNLLLSGSEDHMVVAWDMSVNRNETPIWKESNNCQKCLRPFFWNIKSMLNQKQIGLRQHHCRKCGSAVCNFCSSNRSSLPKLGHEFEVRVCDECFLTIKAEDKTPLAKFYNTKHFILNMSLNEKKNLLVTCGGERVVKLWDISKLVQYSKKK